MSTWIEIKDPEDISITADLTNKDNLLVLGDRDVDIRYSSCHAGNNYISIPLDLLLQRLRDLGVIE